jgi:kynurenine formamidase
MMAILDITGVIEAGMWAYGPPVTAPTIEAIATLDSPVGWEAHRLTLCTLSGTYLEAAAHLLPGGETITQVEPERLVRPATVLQLPDCPPGYTIQPEDLAAAGETPRRGDAVLVASGWDRMWNQPRYVEDSPHFSPAAMDWLVGSGAAIIGGDMPCFDNPAQPAGVNFTLFRAGCLILAPLVNLRRAEAKQLLLVALPLKIKGVCGTPCRAILIDPAEVNW